MDPQLDYESLDAALRRCGASWTAAQSHGLLAGRLAVAGYDGGSDWLQQVLEGVDANNALRKECENLLVATFELTYRQLAERLSEFEPVLPDDDCDTAARTSGLAQWCEGFLHGLVSAKHAERLKKRLAEEPLSDIIRDMLEITRAGVDDDADDESNEEAYTELVEYIRVAAQLAYEELADIRNAGQADAGSELTPDTLH